MIVAFCILGALLVYLSWKSLCDGIDYLNYVRSECARPQSEYVPFATVIVPCRGVDAGLAENLGALMQQAYPGYEVIFAVDDENDAAVLVIRNLINTIASPGLKARKMIVAAKAECSSQKVENLREAVLHASDESRAFVFADSDARPSPNWLRYLIAPLEDDKVGAATGYRWYISKKFTLGSELRSAWNASIATALGPNTKSNFCWGGSMAMRRDKFDQLEMREKWAGTLSDDFAVTRAMNDADLPIVFVPQALTASIESCTLAEMLEFTTRQMKITRVYAPKLWAKSFVGSALFNVVMGFALLIIYFQFKTTLPFAAALIILSAVTILGTAKAWLRLRAVRLVLSGYRPELKRQFWTQNTLWTIAPSIFLYNSIAALLSRRLRWRGTVYELKSPTETVIIAR